MLSAAVLQEIAHQSVSTGRPWDVTHRTDRRSPQRRAASVRTVLQPARAPVGLVEFGDEGDAIVETSIARIVFGTWSKAQLTAHYERLRIHQEQIITQESGRREQARAGDVHQQRPSIQDGNMPFTLLFFVALISTFLLPDPSPISGSSSPTTPPQTTMAG